MVKIVQIQQIQHGRPLAIELGLGGSGRSDTSNSGGVPSVWEGGDDVNCDKLKLAPLPRYGIRRYKPILHHLDSECHGWPEVALISSKYLSRFLPIR